MIIRQCTYAIKVYPCITLIYINIGGRGGHDHMIVLLPMKSVPITTKIVNLNPAHGEVYLMQNYVIKFVSDLQQVSGFSGFCNQ